MPDCQLICVLVRYLWGFYLYGHNSGICSCFVPLECTWPEVLMIAKAEKRERQFNLGPWWGSIPFPSLFLKFVLLAYRCMNFISTRNFRLRKNLKTWSAQSISPKQLKRLQFQMRNYVAKKKKVVYYGSKF